MVAHANEALTVRYDTFGNFLATAGGDNLVKVWDPNKGQEVLRFTDFKKPVTCLEFNLEGNIICAGSVDKTVKVLDIKTQRAKHSFTGHTDVVNCLSMLLRSLKLVSGSSDRSIRLWDYEKLQISSKVDYPSGIFSMDLTQDDSMLATGHNNGTLMIWAVNKFSKITEFKDLHADIITSVCISRDNHYLLTNGKY